MNSKKVILEIEGMTCDRCATIIEKTFNDKDGMLDTMVNFRGENGAFTFNSEKISKEEIINTINQAGNYKVKGEIEIAGNKHNHFDLIIIGGGSAAFSAATTASDLGKSVFMINGGLDIGGTCVNVGCVPSKHLIRTAEQIYRSNHSPFNGVSSTKPQVDFKTIIKQKKELVATMQKLKYKDVVCRLDQVKVMEGWAKFLDSKTIEVNGESYTGAKFLIATGATTNIPEIKGLNEIDYLTNETLFDLEEQPEHLIILGAGYIALEIAQVYRRLGTKVTILQRSERILICQAPDITEVLSAQFQDEGIEIQTNTRIKQIEKKGALINVQTDKGSFEGSHVLIATGVKPNTVNMGLENMGIALNQTGHILVNTKQETNIAHIYAAGDCTAGPAFVYTAAKEGKVAVLNAFTGVINKTDYTALPWVMFTDPQVAGAGMDENEAQLAGIPYESSVMPLTDIPRAQAALDTRGFIKLIRNSKNDQLIGARIIAPEGGELIMQASLAIKAKLTIQDLADTFYPYLTLSEGIKLAAITFNKDIKQLSCCVS